MTIRRAAVRIEERLTLRSWPPPELPAEPYPVLLPYTHPELLAGRDDELAELERRLALPIPILSLAAPSGMGKSSVLAGGLVPRLRAAGRAVALVRRPREPGLAARLIGDLLKTPSASWTSAATIGHRDFVERLLEVERLAGSAAVLVLDQFEDVLAPDARAARTEIGALMAAAVARRPGIAEPPCRFLLAYRQEFHGDLVAWLGDVLGDASSMEPGALTFSPDDLAALPTDLSQPDRFHSMLLAPLAAVGPGSDPETHAESVFRTVLEKPLAGRHYPWYFAEGAAERLARAFAAARITDPDAPLVPELQVVLAHLMSRAETTTADEERRVDVPDDVDALVHTALEDHLHRALEAAFPAGKSGHDVRAARTRALLALYELATVGRDGLPGDELVAAIGADGADVLERLSTPRTRLILLREAPDGFRTTLSHDRIADVVVKTVEEADRSELMVDTELVALRRLVEIKTTLHRAGEEAATRISRAQFRAIAADPELFLRDRARRRWRRADTRRAVALTAASMLGFVVLFWGIWSWARQSMERWRFLERLRTGSPHSVVLALDEWMKTGGLEDDVVLRTLRQRSHPTDFLENGWVSVPHETWSRVTLGTAELVLPWVDEAPADAVLIASLTWALDFGPGAVPASRARSQELRDRVLAPLREQRPPPELDADDPQWSEIPRRVFRYRPPQDARAAPTWSEVDIPAFRLLDHEVTGAEYHRFDPDFPARGEDPVDGVSWYQAYTYAAWLGGRLPTLVEWQLAVRADCVHRYCQRDGSAAEISDVAWWIGNSLDLETGRTPMRMPRKLEPNPWGLYDMIGNVSEWTSSPADVFGGVPFTHWGELVRLDRRSTAGGSVSGPASISGRSTLQLRPDSSDPFFGLRPVWAPDFPRDLGHGFADHPKTDP